MQDHAVHSEKTSAAMSSVLWSALLTGLKIWAGLETNSLGILSEALHSALDFCAAAITFYAVRMAARPADADHQFGHEKVESLSAFIETALLLITCVWISWEAIDRLFFNAAHLDLTWWAFAVVLVSMLVDINRSAMLRRVAKKHKSQALEADALHFTTDIWSSAVVFLGLVSVWCSSFFPQGSLIKTILDKSDAVAALVVATLVCWVAYGLAKRSIHALMDGGSNDLSTSVKNAMRLAFPDYPILRLRLRDGGNRTFVELTIGAPAGLHVDEAHDVTQEIENIVRSVLPEADVVVHVEPDKLPENASPDAIARSLAIRHHVFIHSFAEADRNGQKIVFLDIETPPTLSLTEACASIVNYEKALKSALQVDEIISRIEPDFRAIPAAKNVKKISSELIHQTVEKISTRIPEAGQVTRIDIADMNKHAAITVFCLTNGTISIADADNIASRFENQLTHSFPKLGKLTVILLPKETGE
ncbi:MAG: cation diffusion facilitator family transporter [Akkermansia sp.]